MNSNDNRSDNKEYFNYLAREKYFSDHIVNSSRSMISIINRSYVYEKVNSTFCEAQKGVEESIVGKSLSDVWGDETFNKRIKPNIDKCFSGATVSYEASFNIPQAGKRFFEVIFRPFPAESGEITHLLAETFDITDFKLTQKFASDKEEEFRRFETNLPIGFLRCSPEGMIIHANRAFLIIMDCGNETDIHKVNLRNLYTDKSLFDLHLKHLMDNKPKTFGRVPLVTCKGNDITCRISGFMTVDEHETPLFLDFSFEDSSRELMLENRLLQAQKLETIGALAGGIAHDFNNILTTISGYSELLQNDLPDSSPHTGNVARILAAVAKARSLTNQMLTFSRQVEQEKVTVNVCDVLKETIGFVRSALPSHIKIKSNIRIKKATVFADPTQLFRVFLNLMTNAMQAMEERAGTISVSVALVKGKIVQKELNKDIVADEYALVTVRDTGKGMDTSLLRRIFEPFFTTREVGRGSGLGLSVVHGIVTEMGGEVMVSSKLNEGSVFYVYLPLSKDFEISHMSPEARRRILFITGNRYESRILTLALESAGYDITQSSDPNHLEKMLSGTKNKPNLVLYMIESEQIRTDDLIEQFSLHDIRIPCILITDSNQMQEEEKLVTSGIVKEHLIKPVSLREILSAIKASI